MPRYRVTITEVLTHSGTVEVMAENREEAEELISAEGGYAPEDLVSRTGDVFLEIDPIED